jgi:hypothetical protein
MKPFFIVAIVGFFSVTSRADDQDKVGRYQLIYAAIDSFQSDANLKNPSKVDQKTVFKIDTSTGQVWRLISASIGSHSTEEFVPIQTDKP